MITFKLISDDEKIWLKSLSMAFGSMHVTTDGRDVLTLEKKHYHKIYNPHNSLKFYLANVEQDGPKAFYSATAIPTGLLDLDHEMWIINCIDGFPHDASGSPAMTSTLFGPGYFLHGVNYEPADYFRILEKERGRYIEYQPQKYIDYMASVLGSKINP